jgi:hypothetical protein
MQKEKIVKDFALLEIFLLESSYSRDFQKRKEILLLWNEK